MEHIYRKARDFIYRNARPLDLARWQYHFEQASKEAVIHALSYYQNEDGGFGHALEADSWNPISNPIQTWVATEILREIDFTDKSHDIMKGILSYLESGKDFNGHFWFNTVISNNDYPHAPWWHTESESTCHNNYNPTACLAGFLIRYANADSELYRLASRIAHEAYDWIMTVQAIDMHTLSCFIRLMEYSVEATVMDVFDMDALETKLKKLVKASITTDLAAWESSYICKPSQFFRTKESIFYQDNEEIADYECEFIERTQLEDGSWNISWGWGDYPEQWSISKNWWKSNVILLNMLYVIKGMGYQEK